jgi:hypothetical protein
VLPGKGYCTVRDEYAAMVNDYQGRNKQTQREAYSIVTMSITNHTWCHMGLKPMPHCLRNDVVLNKQINKQMNK